MSEVDVVREGACTVVTMNRPHRRNALTLEFAAEIRDAIQVAGRDPETKCIVLAGEGPAFCAGADLEFLAHLVTLPVAEVADTVYSVFQGLVRAVVNADVPVVAAVGGGAMGAGCDLALACDLRVVSDEGFFEQTWIKLGLIPGMGGMVWATELLGLSRARRLFYRLERPAGAQAVEFGIADGHLPGDDLVEATRAWISPILDMDRAALMHHKRGTARVARARLDEQLDSASTTQALLLSNPAVRGRLEGLLA